MATTVDNAKHQVTRFLESLGHDDLEVGLYNRQSKQMLLRQWDTVKIIANLNWLKHENANGRCIYIRPRAACPIILVDDLDIESVARLVHDAALPPVIVNTSPRNYQCWVHLTQPITNQTELTMISRRLAHRYCGDPNAASWHQFGRLPGFTNRKPQHRDTSGRHPYVSVCHLAVVGRGAMSG